MNGVTKCTALAMMMIASGLCVLSPMSASEQAAGAGNSAPAAKQADAAFHEGYAAANAGDLEKARRSFAEVVRLEPKIPEGHAALGSVLLSLGRPQEAAAECASAWSPSRIAALGGDGPG